MTISILHFIQKLYSLNTLDTRFTTSSKTPPHTTASQIDPARPASKGERPRNILSDGLESGKSISGESRSNWGSAEYFTYHIIVFAAVAMMTKVAIEVSMPSHANYNNYVDLLSPGWIGGRKVDNSDDQYSTFRDNVPYMFMLLILHPLLRKLFESIKSIDGASPASNETKSSDSGHHISHNSIADARLNHRMTFDTCFSLIFLGALHGVSALKVLLILYINFTILTRLPRHYITPFTWTFNIFILFANELCKGYPFATLANFLLPWSNSPSHKAGPEINSNWGYMLDSYGGLILRWEILFKLSILRLISFNLDYCWSLGQGGASPIEVCLLDSLDSPRVKADKDKKKQLDPSNLSERDRVKIPAKSQDYCFRNYLAYVLYSPLYLAGPIITFNDYISQIRYIPKSITRSGNFMYGLRFLICLLAMEIQIHLIYVVAITKATPAWELYTPFQLSMIGYFNLHHIWLKLLLPWRFFRLWALLDGIDPPENMVRCMSDNYSTLAFWRNWHRSFNRWIVRYIYIPMGGSGSSGSHGYLGKIRSTFNFVVVFMFVALWHDIDLRLLVWGWLISLFVAPEILAGFLFPTKKWQNHKGAFRILCGLGAVGNIMMMMAANLVGFAIGLNGLKDLIYGIAGSYSGLAFLAVAGVALFSAAQLMFEIREDEVRQGINMKC